MDNKLLAGVNIFKFPKRSTHAYCITEQTEAFASRNVDCAHAMTAPNNGFTVLKHKTDFVSETQMKQRYICYNLSC